LVNYLGEDSGYTALVNIVLQERFYLSANVDRNLTLDQNSVAVCGRKVGEFPEQLAYGGVHNN